MSFYVLQIRMQEDMLSVPELSKVRWFVDCSGPVLKKMLAAGGVIIPSRFYPAVICGTELGFIRICDDVSYKRKFDNFFGDPEFEIRKSIVGFPSKETIYRVLDGIMREIEDAYAVMTCGGHMLSYDEFLADPIQLSRTLAFICDEFIEKQGYWEIPGIGVPIEEMLDGDPYIMGVVEKYTDTEYEDIISDGFCSAERISCCENIRVCEFGKNFIAWRVR